MVAPTLAASAEPSRLAASLRAPSGSRPLRSARTARRLATPRVVVAPGSSTRTGWAAPTPELDET